MTPEELERIEAQVNAVIRQNSDTSTRLMPTDQAIAAGAEALFGEKYGDEVRVLTMGDDLDDRQGLFGRTVRRHPCAPPGRYRPFHHPVGKRGGGGRAPHRGADLAKMPAAICRGQAEIAREAAAALKTPIGELPARVAQLSEERRRLERELAEAKKALALAGPAKSRRR